MAACCGKRRAALAACLARCARRGARHQAHRRKKWRRAAAAARAAAHLRHLAYATARLMATGCASSAAGGIVQHQRRMARSIGSSASGGKAKAEKARWRQARIMAAARRRRHEKRRWRKWRRKAAAGSKSAKSAAAENHIAHAGGKNRHGAEMAACRASRAPHSPTRRRRPREGVAMKKINEMAPCARA